VGKFVLYASLPAHQAAGRSPAVSGEMPCKKPFGIYDEWYFAGAKRRDVLLFGKMSASWKGAGFIEFLVLIMFH
jgi:hypothetical protein